jgi:hypothetical protein
VKPVVHDGKEISIDHLAPMTIVCSCELMGRELLVDVSFANHCYTEKFVEGVHKVEQNHFDGSEESPSDILSNPVRAIPPVAH